MSNSINQKAEKAIKEVLIKIKETSSYFNAIATDSTSGYEVVATNSSPRFSKRFIEGSDEYHQAISNIHRHGLNTVTEAI